MFIIFFSQYDIKAKSNKIYKKKKNVDDAKLYRM